MSKYGGSDSPPPEAGLASLPWVIFFTHRQCLYYPCHEAGFDLNCLFCFCPFYSESACPGNPCYLSSGLKDCSLCLFPHNIKNYPLIMALLDTRI
ncbi:MAG: cysteine-rich small domain-containing protein [Desulfarculales bacterium]|nr:cysteine-rich small domain-containing protein [Desulfarculales bacterium]